MTVREKIEEQEMLSLSPRAALARHSAGREREIEPCPVRTCFMRDRDRIIHSKAFRRLKHKTQVFVSPEKDHYRTRLTHTLEVSQISRTVARGLRLNEDLTEAIALGHDLGHPPFGHAGERALAEAAGRPFFHNEQSLRIVRVLERDGAGLNLCAEVRDGILHHTGDVAAGTFEGKIVAVADRIAYINHDIDDAIRAGLLSERDIPRSICGALGSGHGARIDTLVEAMIDYGNKNGEIGMEIDITNAMEELREFMFRKIYRNPVAKSEEGKGMDIIKRLYRHFIENPGLLSEEYREIAGRYGLETAVCDYVSGMTDRFAVSLFKDLFLPKGWNV